MQGTNNRHHLFFPRRDYQSKLEKDFRELPCMSVDIDVAAHRELHVYSAPPTMPGKGVMRRLIARHENRKCGCYSPEGVAE